MNMMNDQASLKILNPRMAVFFTLRFSSAVAFSSGASHG